MSAKTVKFECEGGGGCCIFVKFCQKIMRLCPLWKGINTPCGNQLWLNGSTCINQVITTAPGDCYKITEEEGCLIKSADNIGMHLPTKSKQLCTSLTVT